MPFRSVRGGSTHAADAAEAGPAPGRNGSRPRATNRPARVPTDDVRSRFEAFCLEAEPRLRRALVAAYGPQVGADATAAALGWAWEHVERLETMANPVGYLWRVGQSSTRAARHHASWSTSLSTPPVTSTQETRFEPGLVVALDRLSDNQRAAVVLVHGYGYSLAEAADTLGCRIRTLRNHLARGLTKLRHDLGVTDHG